MKGLEYAVGSTVGKDHRTSGRNNQDAYYVIDGDNYFIGVIADGCGSGSHSEVGAKLGVQWTAEALATSINVQGYDQIKFALAEVKERMGIFAAMTKDSRRFISEYLLFTLVGVVITPTQFRMFALGDGYVHVDYRNGESLDLQWDYPGNMPPYLAYGLVDPKMNLTPGLIRVMDNYDVVNFAIATDGMAAYTEAEELLIPGKKKPIGPVSDLWTKDEFYENPDALNRHLRLVNRELVRIDKETGELNHLRGHLSDDTTVIVGRRIDDDPAGEQEGYAQPI